ncbi:FHA domain protein [Planctomycetes bacterium CA13]|uniref:FHA domain protein n=1 Tax=Novipirellula herctigrandis TaxID=2527986 RepID=A0A5C5YNZ5_9BACT|nr:FHA domain protein [Planctomycetes bacterium CA13]
MNITLEVVRGPGSGRKVFLQSGEQTIVGRTDASDYSFADNEEMSGRHFAVVCKWPQWYVKDLGSSNGTMLNGKTITLSELKHDDQIVAGRNVFHVILSGQDQRLQTHMPAEAPAAAEVATTASSDASEMEPIGPVRDEPSGFVATTSEPICEQVKELSEAAANLVQPKQSPKQYLAVLEQNELFTDAIRFLSTALPRRDAVGWAADCVVTANSSKLAEADERTLKVIQTWVADPNETNRRAAMDAAETEEFSTPASWAAVGAFWSEGSMGPPEAPTIPPAPHLTAHAVGSSVMMSAVKNEPERAADKYRQFIQLGIQKGETARE